jgi:hypothetical protein
MQGYMEDNQQRAANRYHDKNNSQFPLFFAKNFCFAYNDRINK